MAGPTTARRGGEKNGKSKAGGSSKPSKPRSSSGRPRPGGGPRKGGAAASRPRSRPSRRRRLLLWSAAAALGGAAVIWLLYGSGWLCVTRVDVSGTKTLTPAEVRAAAAVPLGEPLAAVDTDGIEERLRTRLPRIREVEVVRSWPHGIGLKVTERQPEVLLERGGKFVEIDGSGVRFATVDQAPSGVPRLVMEAQDSPSTRRFGTGRLEQEGVRVAAALPAAIRRDLQVVRVRSYDSITVELAGGRSVVWGSGERGEAKARTLTALLKAAPDARHFDVSAPGAPAVSGS